MDHHLSYWAGVQDQVLDGMYWIRGKEVHSRLERYRRLQGVIHHSSFWPKEGVDVKGKRVAVIGTGATGVQITQEVCFLSFTMHPRLTKRTYSGLEKLAKMAISKCGSARQTSHVR